MTVEYRFIVQFTLEVRIDKVSLISRNVIRAMELLDSKKFVQKMIRCQYPNSNLQYLSRLSVNLFKSMSEFETCTHYQNIKIKIKIFNIVILNLNIYYFHT